MRHFTGNRSKSSADGCEYFAAFTEYLHFKKFSSKIDLHFCRLIDIMMYIFQIGGKKP